MRRIATAACSFSTIMRWTPAFLDTLVPYALVAAEIVPALLLRHFALWWLFMVILMTVGRLAFLHTIYRSSPLMFAYSERSLGGEARDPRQIYGNLQVLLWMLIGCCAAAAAVGYNLYFTSAAVEEQPQPVGSVANRPSVRLAAHHNDRLIAGAYLCPVLNLKFDVDPAKSRQASGLLPSLRL